MDLNFCFLFSSFFVKPHTSPVYDHHHKMEAHLIGNSQMILKKSDLGYLGVDRGSYKVHLVSVEETSGHSHGILSGQFPHLIFEMIHKKSHY